MAEPTTTAHAESLLTDILLRIYVAGAVAFFAAAAFHHWQANPERLTLLLIAVIETITAGIIICSRHARRRDWRPLSVIASGYTIFYILAIDLAPGRHLVPEAVGAGLQLAGMLFQLYAKLALGRSFGLLPATRRLVTSGPYRWLRHPIYFGYLVSHLGFLLSNFSPQNLLVLALLYAAQILRIYREEAILADFPEYAAYRRSVRYRLIPFVF